MNEREIPIFEFLRYQDRTITRFGDTEIVQTKDYIRIQERNADCDCARSAASSVSPVYTSGADIVNARGHERR